MPPMMKDQEITILIQENEKLHKEVWKLRDKIKSLEEQLEKLSKLLTNDIGG